MNSWMHARSTARKWGVNPEDVIKVHEFIDGTKSAFGDVRHRALLHNTYGVWLAQEVFGRILTVTRESGKVVEIPVREIAEQHILEDLGKIPSPGDWLENMTIQTWMSGPQHKIVKAMK
jgi:hypothetical protein